jgi:hypothetical protein
MLGRKIGLEIADEHQNRFAKFGALKCESFIIKHINIL